MGSNVFFLEEMLKKRCIFSENNPCFFSCSVV